MGEEPLSHMRETGMTPEAGKSLHGPFLPSDPMHKTCSEEGLEELVACFGMGQQNQSLNPDCCHGREWSLWALNQSLLNIKCDKYSD